MKTYITDGIVLNRYDVYSDNDIFVVLFTKDCGKITAVAKGAKKLKSRFTATCEPFAHNRYHLYSGRNIDRIIQVYPLNSFPYIRKDLTKISHALYLVELINLFVGERIVDANIFALLLSSLHLIENDCSCELVARYFEINLLSMLGYLPDITACGSCGDDILKAPCSYMVQSNSFFCKKCALGSDGLHFGSSFLSYIGGFLDILPSKLLKLSIPVGAMRDLKKFTQIHIEHILSRKLKSTDFIETVKKLETMQ